MSPKPLLRVATVLFALISAAESAEDAGFVTVRATPGLPDAVIEYIARIAEPRPFELQPNQLPEEVIAAVCGATTNVYLAVYDSLNSKLNEIARARVPRKRWQKLPACIRWEQRNVSVTIEAGNTLDSILQEYIGRNQKARFTCPGDPSPPRCNKTFRDLVQDMNRGEDLDNLRPGSTIFLPFRTTRTTFRIDPSANLSAEQVVAKITELGGQQTPDSPIIQVGVGQLVNLISPLDAKDSDVNNPACSDASQTAKNRGENWPYNAGLVARILTRNAARAAELGQAINPVTITIIDTGLDPTFVPDALLSRDGTEPGNPFGFGTYINNRSNPFADQQPREMRMHGSQVTAIATGATDLREAILKLPVRVKIVNVVEKIGGDYGVTASGVERGMAWARPRSQIANVSIGSETELRGFVDTLQSDRSMLAVVAAGNDRGRVLGDDISLYPAVYGGTGEAGDQVITVAAHDGNLARANFSNRGKKYADIMAPGCEVPFRSGAPGLYGTSFAAPIVAMTAALMRAFGVGLKAPPILKRRLEVSTDFDSTLQDDVLSSGRLNMAKALSVYDDVLQRSGAPLQFGLWKTTPDLDICDDSKDDYKPIAVADIRKVTRVGDDVAPRIRIVHADRQGKLSPDECYPAGDGLTFASLDNNGVLGQAAVVPWTQIVDLVPRYYSSYK
jgi:subtilisin family serine protease